MVIYKILRSGEWAHFQAAGSTEGALIDVADGYIHFSTAKQVTETAAKHFANERGLHLLAVEAGLLAGNLKWEPSRGGQLFPHLYRKLNLADVLWARPIGHDGDAHVMPEGVT